MREKNHTLRSHLSPYTLFIHIYKQDYMKKIYIAPSVEEIEIDTVSIIAASLGVDSSDDNSVDTSVDGVQLGREDNTPSNPNLWEQSW